MATLEERAEAEAAQQIEEMDLSGLIEYATERLAEFFRENPESLAEAEASREAEEAEYSDEPKGEKV